MYINICKEFHFSYQLNFSLEQLLFVTNIHVSALFWFRYLLSKVNHMVQGVMWKWSRILVLNFIVLQWLLIYFIIWHIIFSILAFRVEWCWCLTMNDSFETSVTSSGYAGLKQCDRWKVDWMNTNAWLSKSWCLRNNNCGFIGV